MFSPKNWKRWVIAAFTFVALAITISWTSTSYIAKNINKSVEYGGGAEVLVQVKDRTTEDGKATSETIKRVDSAIYDRLTGGTGLNGTNVAIEGEGKIRISRNGIQTDEELKQFTDEIVKKPYLTITDLGMNPLFREGRFVANKENNVNRLLEDKVDYLWVPPFKTGSAKAIPNPKTLTNSVVSIELKNKEAEQEWADATKYISDQKYTSGSNVMLIWMNISELLEIAQNDHDEWQAAGENLYNYVFVHNNPNGTPGEDGFPPTLKNGMEKYLVSQVSVPSILVGSSFVIEGNFQQNEANQLALNINYGIDTYDLELLSSNFIPKELGNEAFTAALIAGIIAISLIAIFIMINYGLLGALSTISLSLYIFLTLLMFTVVRGEYSPSTIAALIIGIGMSVDANIISFETIKKEVYHGSSPGKANAKSNKLSLGTILDSNITTLLVAAVLFFFGTKDIKGFAVTLIISIIFTILIMLFFTRMMATMFVRTGIFNERLWLLGVNKKYKQKIDRGYVPILERPNYIEKTKWMNWIPLIIVVGGLISFTIFAILGKSASQGFNLSIEFSGGTNILISAKENQLISMNDGKEIISFLETKGIEASEVVMKPIDAAGESYQLVVRTQKDLTAILPTLSQELTTQFDFIKTPTAYSITSQEANSLVINAILSVSISLVAVIIYTLIRLRWTFSIAAIISLIHDVMMVIIMFVICRIEISPIFVAGMLSVIGYSINDTIVTFDRIKEITKELPYQQVNDKNRLKYIANEAIKGTIKRSIFTSLTTIVTVLVLIATVNATDLAFNLTLLFGIIFGTYSSLFIATRIWVQLEVIRNKRKAKRIKSNYWNTQKVQEQTFVGINDFEM